MEYDRNHVIIRGTDLERVQRITNDWICLEFYLQKGIHSHAKL